MAKITALTELAEADVVAADVLVVVDVGSSATKKIKISNIGGAIDGDHLDIDFTPTYYTPATTPAEAADVDDLAAHLQGIDNELNTINTEVATKISKDTASEITAITEKTAPVGNDEILIEDSADSNNKKSLKLSNLGQFAETARPAFIAKLSAEQSDIVAGAATTVLFATETKDQGSDFDTGTYTFTAPLTGLYQFNVVLRLGDMDVDHTYAWVGIVTSNYSYYWFTVPIRVYSADSNYVTFDLSVLADMDIYDTAYVQVRFQTGGNQTDINNTQSVFSGYLAC